MLLQTPLKFWQMCKNFPAKISWTPQFFIGHVNNAGGRWNCVWTLTWRLTGRQGRCALLISRTTILGDEPHAVYSFYSIILHLLCLKFFCAFCDDSIRG